MDLQDEELEADPALHAILGPRWGGEWFEPCDRGRLKVGVTPGGAADTTARVRRARRALRRAGIADRTDLVAVESSLRELSRARDRFVPDELVSAGLVTSAIHRSVNAVHVEVASTLSDAHFGAVRRAARATGVNVILERTPHRTLAIDLER